MKKRKTKVAIIVEVKKREMPFMSILQEVLKRKGYEVKLIPFRSLCTWRLLLFRPNIIMINGLRRVYPTYFSQVYIPKKFFKAKIVCYYSEQVGRYDQSIAKGYDNKVIFDNVDCHIAWGPRFAKDLKELGVAFEKLWYIGSLQYDIDKYLKKTPDEIKRELSIKYNIPYEKKWILYADNIIEKYQPAAMYNVRRQDTYDMIDRVAKLNTDCLIIFRHHPETPAHEIEDARKRYKNNQNIFIISEGHIFDWACCISAFIMWVSTSSIQVMFMRKPIFGFMTSDGKNLDNYWYKDIFPTYNDSTELAKDVYKALNGESCSTDSQFEVSRKKYITDWYFKKDGYAFERLCWLIDSVDKKPFLPLSEHQYFGLNKYIYILFSEIRKLVGDLLKNRFKNCNVTKKDIENELKKFDITQYSNKCFEVEVSDSGHYLV